MTQTLVLDETRIYDYITTEDNPFEAVITQRMAFGE